MVSDGQSSKFGLKTVQVTESHNRKQDQKYMSYKGEGKDEFNETFQLQTMNTGCERCERAVSGKATSREMSDTVGGVERYTRRLEFKAQ